MSNNLALINHNANDDDINPIKDLTMIFNNKNLNKDMLKIIESEELTDRYIKIIKEYKHYSISVIESYFKNKNKYDNNNNNNYIYKFIYSSIIIFSYIFMYSDYCNCLIKFDTNTTYYDIIKNNIKNNFNYTYTENNFSYGNIYNYLHIICMFILNILNIMIISACTVKNSIKIMLNTTGYF